MDEALCEEFQEEIVRNRSSSCERQCEVLKVISKQGSGLYLRKIVKDGYGQFLKEKKHPLKLLNQILYNQELSLYVNILKISHFKGVPCKPSTILKNLSIWI